MTHQFLQPSRRVLLAVLAHPPRSRTSCPAPKPHSRSTVLASSERVRRTVLPLHRVRMVALALMAALFSTQTLLQALSSAQPQARTAPHLRRLAIQLSRNHLVRPRPHLSWPATPGSQAHSRISFGTFAPQQTPGGKQPQHVHARSTRGQTKHQPLAQAQRTPPSSLQQQTPRQPANPHYQVRGNAPLLDSRSRKMKPAQASAHRPSRLPQHRLGPVE